MKYDTRVLKKGSLTVTISKEAASGSAGDRLEAFLKILAAVAGGNRPDQGLPGQGGQPPRPDQGLPPGQPGSGNRPDQGLPGSQPGIDNSLPEPPTGPTDPAYPDNTLPGEPPTAGNLPSWTGEHAKAIAKAILGHCVDCQTAQPKK
jgi:hypothetical protein